MNILTFDIEEWYCIFINIAEEKKTYSIKDSLLKLLNIMEVHNIKPTFFILASFAKKNPQIIYDIAQKYDIGSHGLNHDLVESMSYKDFQNDIAESIRILEDITGKKVTKYRAPGFSISNKEYFKAIVDSGIETDCSLSAINHFYGNKMIDKSQICIIEYNGIKIKEFPPSIFNFLGKDLGFLGGGYFRLFPYRMLKYCMNKHRDYNLIYLHPSDFDVNQPMISEYSFLEKFKRRVGVQTAEKKLIRMLSEFGFTDIVTAEKVIDWSNIPIVQL
ncbi:MAG: polysaccharide deacetylase family protein [Bacteroidales bacterium]|nr:polysaccharide deacetylase family protein [Bacteroidales bacterium]